VPSSTEGSQRVKLDPSTSYDELIENIYEIVGCSNVAKKPQLLYRLSNTTAKSPAVNLGNDVDWEGCLEDVAHGIKKGKGTLITIKITISDVVSRSIVQISLMVPDNRTAQYMASLRAHKKPVKAGGKKKLMNMDNDDEEEDAQEAMQDAEKTSMAALDRALSRCQKCGPEKACLVDAGGNHVHLTFQQRRGWSIALVSTLRVTHIHAHRLTLFKAAETHGVTLKTPPKGEHFQAFHGREHPISARGDTTPIQQHMMQPMGMQGFGGMWPPAYNMMHQMMQQSMPIAQPYATPE
jgi:hypothetical protein